MTFLGLVGHNLWVRKLRLAFAALAVAIGVLAVVTLSVVNHSLRSSALALMQTGRADFTIAQKGVSDLLNSNINQDEVATVKTYPGVANVTGVLLGTTRVGPDNPLFVEIGIAPQELAEFGVTVVEGRAFDGHAEHEVMLGWRAARTLHKKVGDTVVIDNPYQVVGIYDTGQALGDAGAMFPLIPFQAAQRQPGQLTLLFVRATPGTDVQALQRRVDADNPQLVAVRTIAEFGRADRSLSLINAADRGTTVLAVLIGAVIVMSTMLMTFLERIREFGILSAIGWTRRRVMAMVLGESLVIGLLGAVLGVAGSFGATQAVQHLPGLQGVLHPDYQAGTFWRALETAFTMSLLGALYPAAKAAWLAPLEALRHE
ncbi:MAG: ABC transporter permease [Mycobacteriales bacterium]